VSGNVADPGYNIKQIRGLSGGKCRGVSPRVVLHAVVDNRVLNLTRREADVALRPLRPREGDLWGRKIADVGWTVYGAPDYFARHGRPATPADLAAHALIGWEETAAGITAADWLAGVASASAVVYRTTSLINQFKAAMNGIGLAVLPCYLGDPEPGLARALTQPVPELARELWIVTHTDLKRTARVRAFFDVVGDGLASKRALLEGRNA
jgi:DNA-binding transcriptional LysR family regulator